MREGVLKRKKRSNHEISEVKVVSGLAERTKFPTAGAAVSRSEQALTASIIGIVAAVGRSVDIKPVIEIGEIEAAASGVYVDIPGWLQIGTSVGIAAHETNCEVISDPIIDTYDKATCCEVVAFCGAVIIDRYPISPPVRPYAPTILRCGLKYGWWSFSLSEYFFATGRG